MKQTLFERLVLSWKSTLVGLLLIGAGIYVALEERVQASEKAFLVTALVGAGLVLLGVKDRRKRRRRPNPKRP